MAKYNISGGIMVFLGALFWSLNAPIVKFLTIDSFLICGLRSMIAALALVWFIRPRQLRWNIWMLVYVCSYAALCLSIILALTMTSAPVAIGMQYTATIWLFLGNLLKTKRFYLRAFVPVCIILIGVLFFMSSGTDSTSQLGNLIALCEGILFALMTVSAKKAAGENPLGLTSVGNIFTGLVILCLFPASFKGVVGMTGIEWLVMIILGVVQVGGGYAFYNLGIQKVSPQKASVIALWEMILGPVWVALFLKEYPTAVVILGFAIILVGMLLDAIWNSAPAQSAKAADQE